MSHMSMLVCLSHGVSSSTDSLIMQFTCCLRCTCLLNILHLLCDQISDIKTAILIMYTGMRYPRLGEGNDIIIHLYRHVFSPHPSTHTRPLLPKTFHSTYQMHHIKKVNILSICGKYEIFLRHFCATCSEITFFL